MKIDYYKGTHSNFGDDLNPWLWPKIIPDFFDENGSTVFLGIGSILGEKTFPATVRKVVFGAGFVPEYHAARPDVSGPDWSVYFVRGPRTAKMLGLSASLGLGDPAILLRTIIKPQPSSSGVISFMPHWESLERGNWGEACRLAGIALIDPRSPVETVIRGLQSSRIVIAEAMHGAIVADALRIPWLPLSPLNYVHRTKWFDWSESLEMDLRPRILWPSRLPEARLSFLRGLVEASPFMVPIDNGLLHAAAHRLVKLSGVTPFLSEDRVIDRSTSQMLEKVAQLRKDFA